MKMHQPRPTKKQLEKAGCRRLILKQLAVLGILILGVVINGIITVLNNR